MRRKKLESKHLSLMVKSDALKAKVGLPVKNSWNKVKPRRERSGDGATRNQVVTGRWRPCQWQAV